MGVNDEKLAGEHFAESISIMARLRGPVGCPWDREQSFESIRKYTLEETYEVFDAIERGDWPHLEEELGDLLLQILFYAQLASEPGYFTIVDVIKGLNRKLVRRHPHVFGDAAAAAAGNGASGDLPTQGIDAAQVLRNWEAIKSAEKAAAKSTASMVAATVVSGTDTSDPPGEPDPAEIKSRLASIPRAMPALMEAQKLGSQAAKSGFDWPDREGLFTKLEEEIAELQDAISTKPPTCIEEEVGDLLFTVANLARHLKVDPEMALRRANSKFRTRFASMEVASGRPLEELDSVELEELWSRAKGLEHAVPGHEREPGGG